MSVWVRWVMKRFDMRHEARREFSCALLEEGSEVLEKQAVFEELQICARLPDASKPASFFRAD